MAPRNKDRTLWLTFTIGLTISLVGAIILFNPTLEFFAFDLLEKLHLPTGLIGNIAFISDATLLAVSAIGLITLTVRAFFRSRPNP